MHPLIITTLQHSRRLALPAALTALALAIGGCGILTQEKNFDAPLKASGLRLVYPSGSIVSVALADKALGDASARRSEIEAQYLRDESPCYDRFFVTRCVDAGKERRRIALAEVRAVEVEADYIKRRDTADQRDKAIAERAAQDLAEAPQRLKDTQANEKAAAERNAQRAADQAKVVETEKRQAGVDPQARQHSHDAKVSRQQAAEPVEQGKRAANVAAFEKKQQEAAEAQKKVAENKAKKAAEAKAAAERAATEAAAAAAAAEKK